MSLTRVDLPAPETPVTAVSTPLRARGIGDILRGACEGLCARGTLVDESPRQAPHRISPM